MFVQIFLFMFFTRIKSSSDIGRNKAISYLKGLSFEIPQGKILLSERKEITSSWFVDYKLRPRSELKNPEGATRYDPFLSVMTVTNDGIYFKRISETWRKLDPLNYLSTNLDTLHQCEIENLITAAHSAGNDSVLIVATQDLKITTYELRDGDLKILSVVDTMFGENEGDYIVKSIWKIPYSNFAMASSNRYEILKFNFLTGDKQRIENKLGPIRHIVGPVETDDPEREPYNPRADMSFVPQHLKKLEKKNLFIATGDTKPINFIGDWTTTQPLHFFSLESYSKLVKEELRNDYIVQSIAFIGVNPRSHTYAMTTKNSKLLFIYNAMMMKLDFYKENAYNVMNLRWINGTRFLAQQTAKDYFYLIHVDEYTQVEISNSLSYMMKLYGISFEMEKGGEEEDSSEGWSWLKKPDRLWLSLENVENKLNILPPYYSFEECYLSMSSTIGSGIYGRYRHCGKCNLFTDDFSPIDPDSQISEGHENQTYVNCQMHCNEGEVAYGYVSYKVGNNERQYNRDMIPAYGANVSCEARYEVLEEEKKFSFDDGCRLGFTKNLYGACQECQDLGCSDCYRFFGVSDTCMTNNIYQFEVPEIENPIKLKGHQQHHENSNFMSPGTEGEFLTTYRKKYFFDTMMYEEKKIYKNDFNQFWEKQTKRLRMCYTRNYFGGENYILGVKKGYSLKLVEQVNFDYSQQKEPGNPEDPLNSVVCVKNCPIGFYYDYTSLSCRRCSFRCAKCSSYNKCEVCQPGMNLNEIKEDFIQNLNMGIWGEKLKNFCYQGCVQGSYMKLFDGNCFNCEKDCIECEDALIKGHFYKFGIKRQQKGFCLTCKEKDEKGNNLILDALTGECVKDCKGEGRFLKNDSSQGEECDFCLVKGCDICNQHDKRNCSVCRNDLILGKDQRSCVDEVNWVIVYVAVLVFLSILILVILLIMVLMDREKKVESDLKEESIGDGVDECVQAQRPILISKTLSHQSNVRTLSKEKIQVIIVDSVGSGEV